MVLIIKTVTVSQVSLTSETVTSQQQQPPHNNSHTRSCQLLTIAERFLCICNWQWWLCMHVYLYLAYSWFINMNIDFDAESFEDSCPLFWNIGVINLNWLMCIGIRIDLDLKCGLTCTAIYFVRRAKEKKLEIIDKFKGQRAMKSDGMSWKYA